MKATLSRNYNSKSAALRDQLNHPVVDADGHTVEFEPGVLDYLKDIAGSAAVDRYKSSPEGAFIFPWNHMTERERLEWREFRPVWWGHPMRNMLDRATSTLPTRPDVRPADWTAILLRRYAMGDCSSSSPTRWKFPNVRGSSATRLKPGCRAFASRSYCRRSIAIAASPASCGPSEGTNRLCQISITANWRRSSRTAPT